MIVVQFVFIILILSFLGFALHFVQQNITATIVSSIQDLIVSGSADSTGLENKLKTESGITLTWIVLIVGALTIVFGFIVSRITLYPARHSLELQKTFVSNIAHELRTPLSILRMNTEIALLEGKVPPTTQQKLQSNIEELDRMSEIINNLLSFNSVIRKERMAFDNTDLGKVVEDSIAKVQDLIDQKNTAITFQKSKYRTVWGNATALEQVVINLLKNAVMYTPQDGHVTISTKPDYKGNILLSIHDTGVGIKQEDLFHIFEPFYRADRSRKRSRNGSGLGLTIVSEIVKLHNGKITLQSAPQKGTRFVITLPSGRETSEHDEEDSHDLNSVSLDFSKNSSFLS